MSDLRELMHELSTKQLTRRQFLAIVAGSVLGISGLFRFMQAINTPEDLAHTDKGVFGEREYGHVEGAVPTKTNEYAYNSEDVFG